MDVQRITLLGSSHVFALHAGIDSSFVHSYTLKHLADFQAGSRIVLPIDGGWEDYHLNPSLGEWLVNDLEADRIALTIGGSDWLHLCLTQRPEPFDFILPNHPDLAEIVGATLIPYTELKRQLRHIIRHVVLGIKLIRDCVTIPIDYIEPPPPLFDNDYVSKYSKQFHEHMETFGITDPVLRMKTYLLHSEIIAEACCQNNIRMFHVPEQAKTVDGYLIPDEVGTDPMHANSIFGRRVMKVYEAALS
jgi:hypothetical protein